MTPQQRLLFCNLLKEASINRTNITVNDVVSKIGIDKDEANQLWHSDFKVTFAFEHNYKWVLHAKEFKQD
jgi:hypothetical protein